MINQYNEKCIVKFTKKKKKKKKKHTDNFYVNNNICLLNKIKYTYGNNNVCLFIQHKK